MLALSVYRAGLCPNCGGPMSECGPKTRGKWKTKPPRRCQRMDMILIAQEGGKHDRTGALSWTAERKP